VWIALFPPRNINLGLFAASTTDHEWNCRLVAPICAVCIGHMRVMQFTALVTQAATCFGHAEPSIPDG